jgi:hypothetical protein
MSITLDEAYQMYMMGIGYREICQHMGLGMDQARWKVKCYALENNLLYPRPAQDHTLLYNLYLNKMAPKDIARYLGIRSNKVWDYLDKHCRENYLPMPTKKPYERAQVAYALRQRGLSYSKVAKMVGYYDRSNCFNAIKAYCRTYGVGGKTHTEEVVHTDDHSVGVVHTDDHSEEGEGDTHKGGIDGGEE